MNRFLKLGVSLVFGGCFVSSAFSKDGFCYTKEKGIYSCAPVEITTDDKSFCEGKYVCQKDGAYIDAEGTPADSDQNKACEDLGGKMVPISKGEACDVMKAVTSDFFLNVSNECATGCGPDRVDISESIVVGTCCQLKIKINCVEIPARF